jgi:hypothetical protein
MCVICVSFSVARTPLVCLFSMSFFQAKKKRTKTPKNTKNGKILVKQRSMIENGF